MAGYSLAFLTDVNAIPFSLYLRLRSLKIDDASLDRGSLVINSNGTSCPKRTLASCRVGKGDHKITAEEVFDTAFEIAEKDAFFGIALQKEFDIKIPWIWNVTQPIIPVKDMHRFWDYTTFLKDSLQKHSLDEGTPAFQDALALGIFYFVVTPRRDFVGEWDHSAIIEKELLGLGWQDINDYLRTKGGLFTARGTGKTSVLESLDQGELRHMHLAILLYSALRVVGIPVAFAQGEGVSTKDPDMVDAAIYTCVQIPSRNGVRLMNPYRIQSDARFSGFTAISPRQMIAFYHIFLASDSSTDEGARKNMELASIIDPNSPIVRLFRGIHWLHQNNLNQASVEIEKAIAIAPKLPKPYGVRAILSVEKKDFDKANQDAMHAVELSPTRHDLVQLRAEIYALQGDWNNALKDYVYAYRLNKTEFLEEFSPSIVRAVRRLWSDKGRETLRQQFGKETGFYPEVIEGRMIAHHFSWTVGRPKTATVLATELLHSFHHPETYSEPVRKELHRMIELLPSEMRDLDEIKLAIGRIP